MRQHTNGRRPGSTVGVLLGLAILTNTLAAACGELPPTSPSSAGGRSPSPTSGGAPLPTTSPSPQPSPSSTRYFLSGRVTDEAGSPIAGATVEVDHGKVPGSFATSNCPGGGAFCWVATRTNGNGEYAVEVEAGLLRNTPAIGYQYAPGIGYIYSFASGYETNVQWVPAGGPLLVQTLQLRAVRPIRPGESTSVSVDPTGSLCTDLEDWWVLNQRCAIVPIEVIQSGTLVVDVRAAAGGSVVPFVFRQTSGNYPGQWTRIGPSTISTPVSAGTARIFIGLPEGSATQQFDVVTSLR